MDCIDIVHSRRHGVQILHSNFPSLHVHFISRSSECCARMFPPSLIDPNLLVCSLNMLAGYLCDSNSKWCKQHHCKSASCELSLSSHLSSHLGVCVCSAHVLQSNQDVAICLQSVRCGLKQKTKWKKQGVCSTLPRSRSWRFQYSRTSGVAKKGKIMAELSARPPTPNSTKLSDMNMYVNIMNIYIYEYGVQIYKCKGFRKWRKCLLQESKIGKQWLSMTQLTCIGLPFQVRACRPRGQMEVECQAVPASNHIINSAEPYVDCLWCDSHAAMASLKNKRSGWCKVPHWPAAAKKRGASV